MPAPAPATQARPLAPDRPKRAGGTSRFRGVYWNAKARKWAVVIRDTNQRTHNHGYFDDETAAARRHDDLVRSIKGPGAALNFPELAATPGQAVPTPEPRRPERRYRFPSTRALSPRVVLRELFGGRAEAEDDQ